MSWEHRYYDAVCSGCGKSGFKVVSSDDWGRTEISWKGFKPYTNFPSHEYLVARKKIDADEHALCGCGSADIKVGNLVDVK